MKKVLVSGILVAAFISLVSSANSQQAVPRNPKAVYVVSQAVLAMGGSPPADSVATGTVHIVEGSAEEDGTTRILTRGSEETREEYRTDKGVRGRIYSKGHAAEISDTRVEPASLELAASSQTPCFPLVLLASALNNPDFAFEFVGEEPLDGAATYHVRFWNTYASASNSRLQELARFSVKQLWIDAATGLPRKLSYEELEARGNAPRIPVAAIYSDYRNVGGVLYPYMIERLLNGAPWATIRIASVELNVGLVGTDFATQ